MLQLAGKQPQRTEPKRGGNPLEGKKVYIPPMAHGSSRAFAATFRALGVDAAVTPPSCARTRELGARFTSGDECYPAKVTVGDFMKVLLDGGEDPSRTVFFMPTADGPCRFGQYAPYLRHILDANGYTSTGVLSPSSSNSYADLGDLARPFVRTGWRMLVAGDILLKMLLTARPYEAQPGATEAVYERAIDELAYAGENAPLDSHTQMEVLLKSLTRSRDRFRAVPVKRSGSTLRIGVVGEIFCRLNSFSNEDLIKRLEAFGVEVWLSDISEWVWYTMSERMRKLKLLGRSWSLESLGAAIRRHVQHRDEQQLLEPFEEDFRDCREPDIETIIRCAEPYLPARGALGEMVLNAGKAVYLSTQGVDGIIDISPFTCMNGIVSEAIYPKLSRDMGGIPIRNFYFDGSETDLERDLGVFVELAHTYRRRRQAVLASP